ncbi:ComEA family DNA-binding protein [Thermomonospora umbrina]|nr:helix-hairpin-helix domain-containing protein [Thermomonospora umbrina]
MPHRPLPPPPPEPPPPQGVLWAFTPFLSGGFGTWGTFGYAALRRRSGTMAAMSAGYLLSAVAVLGMLGAGGALAGLGMLLMMTLWITGTVHAFGVRSTVYPPATPRDRVNQHAIHVAKYRRTLREEARSLVAEDPELAHELCIGRPDLSRVYDDGGLIDVNHVPPFVLASLPGMTPELVERITGDRQENGPFVSVEELAVRADLPPDLVPRLGDYTLFLT